jgi:hypothetical protein
LFLLFLVSGPDTLRDGHNGFDSSAEAFECGGAFVHVSGLGFTHWVLYPDVVVAAQVLMAAALCTVAVLAVRVAVAMGQGWAAILFVSRFVAVAAEAVVRLQA